VTLGRIKRLIAKL